MTDPLLQACHDYLSAKHCTLWSDFDISRPDRLDAAARWLHHQIQGVAEAARYADNLPREQEPTTNTRPLSPTAQRHLDIQRRNPNPESAARRSDTC